MTQEKQCFDPPATDPLSAIVHQNPQIVPFHVDLSATCFSECETLKCLRNLVFLKEYTNYSSAPSLRSTIVLGGDVVVDVESTNVLLTVGPYRSTPTRQVFGQHELVSRSRRACVAEHVATALQLFFHFGLTHCFGYLWNSLEALRPIPPPRHCYFSENVLHETRALQPRRSEGQYRLSALCPCMHICSTLFK